MDLDPVGLPLLMIDNMLGVCGTGLRGHPSRPPSAAPRTMDEAVADHIRSVLDRVGWQVAGSGGAAELLDMNPSTLRFRMKKLRILPKGSRRFRPGVSPTKELNRAKRC